MDTASAATTSRDAALAGAYAYLQRVTGIIALLLPVVVAVGDWLIGGHGVRGSISSYYYGHTGGYFVGSLCALAVFFLSYDLSPRTGHAAQNRLGNVAAGVAAGVALFPTARAGTAAATGTDLLVSRVHVTCAAVLFVLLAVFSLYHFTATAADPRRGWDRAWRIFTDPKGLDRRQRRFTRIHRALGWTIVAAIAGIVVNNLVHWHAMFWLESIAVWAFGISWLVKGAEERPLHVWAATSRLLNRSGGAAAQVSGAA